MGGADGQESAKQGGEGPASQPMVGGGGGSKQPKTGQVGMKHILIAFGGLAVIIGGLVFALMGDQPDFVCRLQTGCREFGYCTSSRFSCVVASDKDCARSEGCRTSNKCIMFEGRCASESERAAVAAMKASEDARTAVADYLKLVEVGARGGNTSIAVASFFAASQVEGFAVESPEPRLEAAEWGAATFNGRSLPAAITRTTFAEVNRSEGKRRRSCIVSAAINDKEFGMWRGLQAWSCTNSKLTENLAAWRNDTTFQVKGSWAENPTVAITAR